MTVESFNSLANFNVNEKNFKGERLIDVENIRKVNDELMFLVDAYVSDVKKVFKARNPVCIVHFITSGTHTKDSAHPLGQAIDCHITSLSLYEQFMMASLYGFTGIGYYPYSTPCFLHLDIKELDGMRRRIWYRDAFGDYIDFRKIQQVLETIRGPFGHNVFLNNSD